MAKKTAKGNGSIRKKTVMRKGKEYTYWEARVTVGRDSGTGKQVQRSVTGKTQKEVAEKLRSLTVSIDVGDYTEPNKMTVGDWLDIWVADYLVGVKPLTVAAYQGTIKNHIKPALGAIRLDSLNAHTIQGFYNKLSEPKNSGSGLSAKSIKNVHGILHKALQQAVSVGYLRFNPSDACTLPRVIKKEIVPLDEEQSKAFIQAIKGHPYETLFSVTLFTGMREGEVLGLMWNCIDFNNGTIVIDKQLQREKKKGGKHVLVPTKNSKGRTIAAAPWVMQMLKQHKVEQTKQRLNAGSLWQDSGLVFTNEVGENLVVQTVYKSFKRVVRSIGCPDARFHDLRHSYAVASIRSGDDIKTVQGNLGHATASFTLDVYGHVTEQMKQQSAARMESYIKDVLNL